MLICFEAYSLIGFSILFHDDVVVESAWTNYLAQSIAIIRFRKYTCMTSVISSFTRVQRGLYMVRGYYGSVTNEFMQ